MHSVANRAIIRDRQDMAHSYEPYVSLRTTQDFNTFRIGLFHAVNATVEA